MTDKFQKISEEIVRKAMASTAFANPKEPPFRLVDGIAEALHLVSSSLAKKFLDAVPEIKEPKDVGEAFDCSGWNAARSKLLEVIKSEGIEVNP